MFITAGPMIKLFAGDYHQRDALRNHARKPILPQQRKTSVPSRFIQEILSFLKLLSVDDVSRSPDQSRIRKCPENRDSQRVPLLPSPLLYGPFLISPRRNQNATPRISTPKQPCPDIKSQRQKPLSSGSGVASGTPTRRGPPWAPNQAIPAGLPASRFRIFLLIEYPYTTLSSRAGRRLSTHAHLSEFSFSSRILQSTGTPPHLSVGRSPASLTHIRVV